jgi:hypothetical protein
VVVFVGEIASCRHFVGELLEVEGAVEEAELVVGNATGDCCFLFWLLEHHLG